MYSSMMVTTIMCFALFADSLIESLSMHTDQYPLEID